MFSTADPASIAAPARICRDLAEFMSRRILWLVLAEVLSVVGAGSCYLDVITGVCASLRPLVLIRFPVLIVAAEMLVIVADIDVVVVRGEVAGEMNILAG